MSPDRVPADDRGLLLGDGLFETLLAQRGVLEDFRRHFQRMAAGCAVLGIAPPREAVALLAATDAIGKAGLAEGRAAVRLTLTAGNGRGLDRPLLAPGRLIAQAGPAPDWQGGVSLATAGVRRNQGSPASRLKTLSYLDSILARREARAAGAEEALMLNGRGEIACAAAANVFWIADGRLHTPALECGVLDGIVRGRVIERAKVLGVEVIETAAPADALALSEGAFLTNSLIGVRPVASLDGHALAQSALTTALSSPDRGSAAPAGA
jgi:branched-chain amino acid aminotransferase/4-amino-4-deoxychorismate lyase